MLYCYLFAAFQGETFPSFLSSNIKTIGVYAMVMPEINFKKLTKRILGLRRL